MPEELKIIVAGHTGSGKSAIIRIIADALQNAGFNSVSMVDVDNYEQELSCEFNKARNREVVDSQPTITIQELNMARAPT